MAGKEGTIIILDCNKSMADKYRWRNNGRNVVSHKRVRSHLQEKVQNSYVRLWERSVQ